MLSAWTGITQPPSWGEKQALSLCYTIIYYCAKVIIINLELHLLREIRDGKKQEMISPGKLSPLDLLIHGGLSRPIDVHTCVCKIRIATHTPYFYSPALFSGTFYSLFTLFLPAAIKIPLSFPPAGTFPPASATEMEHLEPDKQFTPFPEP